MKTGRPRIKHDPAIAEQVQSMSQYGVPQAQIAEMLGLSVQTLRNLYGAELGNGMTLSNLAVGKKLFERCMAGDVPSLIFWAKTRMGWKETQKVDVTSSDGSMRPLPQAVQVILVDAENGRRKA